MKSYDTYIFDLDGTITNTMMVWVDIFRDGLLHFGITPPDDKTLSQYTHDWDELVKIGLSKEKLADFAAFAHIAANERLPKAPLHEGAIEMLDMLRSQGKKIGFFSTMDSVLFEPAMQYRNLYQFADVALSSTDVPYRKPHPAGILKALENLGVPEEEFANAVYIGDKDTDIQAAHNAKIASILYYPCLLYTSPSPRD